MATPTDLSIWLREQAWPISILAAVLFFTYLSLHFSAARRRRTLNRQREGVSEASFAEYLTQFGVDDLVAVSVYRYLQQVQNVKFPILPSDALHDDLGLDPEDVRQTVADLLTALGRIQSQRVLHIPILTVFDLVAFLQASPCKARYNAA